MNEIYILIAPLIAGGLLGLFFFSGLWLTVGRAASSNYPAVWFAISLVLRTGVVLTGFYLLAGLGWESMLTGLAGFLIARFFLTRAIRGKQEPATFTKRSGHEH